MTDRPVTVRLVHVEHWVLHLDEGVAGPRCWCVVVALAWCSVFTVGGLVGLVVLPVDLGAEVAAYGTLLLVGDSSSYGFSSDCDAGVVVGHRLNIVGVGCGPDLLHIYSHLCIFIGWGYELARL